MALWQRSRQSMAAIRTNACDGKGRRDKLIVLRHRRYDDLRCNLAGDTPDWLLGTWLSASRVLRNMVACAILAAKRILLSCAALERALCLLQSGLNLNYARYAFAEECHGLDHPDPRRDLHRPRDQRLPAGRILISLRFPPEMGLTAIVLGAAAGGGFPQWNCNCDVCRLAWAGDPRVRARTQASLAVSADGKRWTLLNASPDLRAQIQATAALHPRGGMRGSPIDAVVLTGAEIDQTAGLLSLRERSPFTLDGHGRDARRGRRQSDVRRARRRRGAAPRDRAGRAVSRSATASRPSCSWCRARCRSISKATIPTPRAKARPTSASRSPTAARGSPMCRARRR